MTVISTQQGSIAVLTIDNPPVNALNRAVRAQLLALADQLAADPSVTAVVLCAAGKLFVGDADIAEFDRPPEPPSLPDVIAAIEAQPKPWVTALHGSALGGGLELALACHYRLAAMGATLGRPEVGFGMIPGLAEPSACRVCSGWRRRSRSLPNGRCWILAAPCRRAL